MKKARGKAGLDTHLASTASTGKANKNLSDSQREVLPGSGSSKSPKGTGEIEPKGDVGGADVTKKAPIKKGNLVRQKDELKHPRRLGGNKYNYFTCFTYFFYMFINICIMH